MATQEENYHINSIDENEYSNIHLKERCMSQDKKLSIREQEIRRKLVIKQHKDKFTFGVPTKYTKLQNNINDLLCKIDSNHKPGYSNERQKRVYKNELYQESFQNKMGLVLKPTKEQLMIADFVREKKHKGNSGIKTKNSDSSFIYNKRNSSEFDESWTNNSYQNNIHRRHTSKIVYRNDKHTLEAGYKRKGRVSKIRLRKPSNIRQVVIDDPIMVRQVKVQKRERNKSQEGFISIHYNAKNCSKISDSSVITWATNQTTTNFILKSAMENPMQKSSYYRHKAIIKNRKDSS
jgi:hypothetical protein